MSKILVADDDPLSRKLLGSLLSKWGYEPEIVDNGLDARHILRQESAPNLAILDWMMPGLDGLQVVKELRHANRDAYTYVLLLTSKAERADVLAGLDAGADDYLKKPFDAQELRARLRVGSRILDLQRKLVCALATSEHRATHDFLCGLYNRGAIIEILTREVARWHREKSALSVCIADVDHFKAINDTYGHMVGDEVLKQLSRQMTSLLRTYDSIGRYGGEEFLIVIPYCDSEKAASIAERIRSRFALGELSINQSSIPVTISLGVSTISPENSTVSGMLQAADVALYAAKNKGRNRVELYTPELARPIREP
jgi:two-component system cell cycle response regulator